MSKNTIEALLIERAGYVLRKLPARVAAVDAALRELGFEHKLMTQETATAQPVSERAVKPAVSKRSASKQ